MGPFWSWRGHATEARRWLERAIALAPEGAGAPLARVAHWLGVLLQRQGEFDAALRLLHSALSTWRDLGDLEQQARELNSIGVAHLHSGDLDTARSFLEDSAAVARKAGSQARLAAALNNLGIVEIDAGRLDRASQVLRESLTLHQTRGDVHGICSAQQGLALAGLRAGRAREAWDMLSRTYGHVIDSGDVRLLADTLELAACIAAELGDTLPVARLVGAAETVRELAGVPLTGPDAALLERFVAPARATVERQMWDAELAAGRALTQQQAVALLRSG
jgi:tetratricopeptide (TPR) repeat protein